MEHINENFIGWFTYPRMYKDIATNLSDGSIFVEVGTYEGKSLAYYIVEMINANKYHKVYGIDSFTFENLKDNFDRNMAPLLGHFRIITAISWEAPKFFKDASIDAVFIDADHVYESVKKDILAWLPKVKKGGFISGHDYCDEHPGVIKAVNEIFGNEKVCFDYIDELCWKVNIQ